MTSSATPSSSSNPSVSTSNPVAQLQPGTPSRKAAEAVQYTDNKCPECQVQFCSKEEVAAHFQEVKPAFSNVSLLYRMCAHTIRWYYPGPALGIGDVGGRLERHLLEGRHE